MYHSFKNHNALFLFYRIFSCDVYHESPPVNTNCVIDCVTFVF